MRYIFETKDEEGLIGIQISKWDKQKKIEMIEKAEPVVEIKDKLEKISRALATLEKSGWNKEVMLIYIAKKTGLGMGTISAVMKNQQEFFKAIGVKI